ncbi:MAG: fibronectin type III domain-containing protein [Flavobacterium sp.]
MTIAAGATVTVNAAAANAGNITITSGGTLTVSGNTLTVGCTSNNNFITNNGTLNVSGGTLVVNGNINNTSASIFSQTGGQITIDGNNNNTAATSVATATPLFWLQNTTAANVTLSGGTLTIVDPHVGTATSDDVFRYSGGVTITASTNHTLQLGDGVSTQAGGNTTNGYSIAANSSGRVVLGNVVVNAPTPGTTRFVANRSSGDQIGGNLTVTAGEFRVLSGNTTTVAGNISNSGTLTTIGTLQLAGITAGAAVVNTAAQTIGGTGAFQNLAASPTANFASLTINNSNATGVTFGTAQSLLSGANTGTISGTLTLTSGLINTSGNTFIIGVSGTSAGTLSYTAGGFAPGASVQRWVTTSAITVGNSGGHFPFTNATSQARHAYFGSASAITAGWVKVQYNDVAGTTPVSISDVYNVSSRSNSNWVVTTGGGLAITSSDARMRFRGDGIFTLGSTNNFLAVGASAAANGTSVIGSGTVTAPEANKTAMTTANLSQTVYVGTANTIVSTTTGGAWDAGSSWVGGVAPGCNDSVIIAAGATITVNGAAANSSNIVINGTLTVSGNTLTVGCVSNNNYLNNNGTLNVSGGTLAVNGNINNVATSVFSQTGGQIIIDGNNNNTAATSVATGTPLFWLQNTTAANVTLSGGTLTIVDPHVGTATNDDVFRYSGGVTITASANHTLQLGDGVSVQAGGNTTNGYSIAANSSGRVVLGNVVVNAPTPGTTRFVTNRSSGDQIGGALTVTAGEFRILSGNTTTIAGNIVNSGTLTTIGTLQLAGITAGSVVANPAAQTIDGAGTFQNLTTSSTANFTNLTINNGNATGVTFNNAQSLLSGANTGTVSGTLTFTAGKVNTGANVFYLGISSLSVGTLSYTAGGFTSGSTLAKWYSAVSTGTTITAGSIPSSTGTGTYPFIAPNGIDSRTFYLQRPTTTGAALGTIRVQYVDAAGLNTLSPTLADATAPAVTMDMQTAAKWTVTTGNSFSAGTGTFTYAISGANLFNPTNTNARLVKQTSSTTASLSGTFQAGTTLPHVQSGSVSASNFTGDFAIGLVNTDNSFVSVANGDWNTASTWNKNAVPTSADNIYIGSGTNVTISDARTVNSVIVNPGGILTASAGTLTVNTTLANNGTVNVNGGTITTTTSIANNASATINVASGALTSTTTLTNAGTINATGGTITSTTALTNSGTANVNGGTITATTTLSNSGTFNTSAGNLIVNGGSAAGITNSSSGSFIVNGGTVRQGPVGGGNTMFTNSGILTVSSGTLNINGSLTHQGTQFNQSGGNINLDPNAAGVIANSTTSSNYTLNLTSSSSGSLNWTGGTLTLVDPPATASSIHYSIYYNMNANSEVSASHTLGFGDGTSVDAGGAGNSFLVYNYVGSYKGNWGNMLIKGTPTGTPTSLNRIVKQSSYNNGINGNLTVNNNAEFDTNSITFTVGGDITINTGGVFTSTALVTLAKPSGTSSVVNTVNQTISGGGTFRNSSTASTANILSLTVNTNNTVTLGVPVSISGTLTMTSGLISTTSTNLLTLGTATAGGTLSCTPSATNMIVGPFARTFAARTATGTYDSSTLFPVGKGSTSLPMYIDPTATGVVVFSGEAFNSTSGSTFSGGATSLSANRFEALPVSGAANLTNAFVRLSDTSIANTSKILQSPNAVGNYTPITAPVVYAAGTFNTLTTTAALPVANYTGYFAYGNVNTCTTPTAQPTAFVTSIKTTTTFTGSYTAAAGNPTGYLAVRYAAGATVTAPADFTTYAVGATLGAGTVLYSGTALTFNATGLTANTAYDIYVYSFNNSGCTGPVYYTTAPLVQNITTCTAVTGATGTPTASNLSQTGVTVTWTASSTSGVTYYVDVATNSGFTSFAPGYNNYNAGTSLSTNITGLTGSTSYWIRVRAEVGGCSSTVSSSLAIATLCPAVDVTYTEDFESAIVPALPACTSNQNVGTGNDWTTSSPAANGFTSKVLTYIYNSGSAANTWFFTRGVNLTAGTNYIISYKYGTNSTAFTEKLKVMYGTAPTAAAMTLPLADQPSITGNTVANPNSVVFTPSANGVYYFGFNVYSASNQNRLYIDDISVTLAPTCFAPTSILVNTVTSSSAKINWTAPTLGTPVQYVYEVRTSGAAGSGSTGLVAAASGTTTGAPLFVNVAGLSASTTYSVYVKSDCGSGDSSTWTTAVTFTTSCSQVTSLSEGFETTTGDLLPSCWTKVGSQGTAYTQASTGITGSRNLYIYNGSGTLSARPVVALPPVSNAASGTMQLSMKVRANSFTGETIEAGYLTDPADPATFVVLGSLVTNSTSVPQDLLISPVTTPAGVTTLAIRTGIVGWSTLIDDVVYSAVPTCYIPTGIALSNVTDTTARVSWTAPTTGTAPAQYIYEVRTSGAAGSGSTGLVAAASGTTSGAPLFVNVAGLTASTTYSFYIKSDCGSGGLSGWSAVVTFTTPCAATNVTYTEDFESVTVPAIPACTSTQNVGTGNDWTTSSPAANGFTSKTLTYIYNLSNPANSWFYTRGVNLTAGSNYIISYKYGTNSTTYTEKMKVMYGTTPTAAGMATLLADHPSITGNTVANPNSVIFTASTTGVYYFGFNVYSAANQNRLYVDDISIAAGPTCVAPSGITITNLTDVSARINWTAAGGTPTQYIYEVRTSGAAGSGATGLVAAASGTTTGTPLFVNVSGLAPTTAYSVYVRSDCGAGDLSAWTAAVNFTTPCTIVTLPKTELFNASTIPSCWTQQNIVGSLALTFPASGSNPTVTPQEGSNMVYYNSYSNSTQTRLVSTTLSSMGISAVNGIDVEFYWYHSTEGGATSYLTEGVTPQWSTDGGATWTSVGSQIRRYNSTAGWTKYIIKLPSATVNQSSLNIAFLFQGNSGYNCYLDNVTIKEGASCVPPSGVSVNNITSSSAKINWAIPVAGSTPAQYIYEVRTSGAAGSGATGLVAAASGTTTGAPLFVDVTGLASGTTYNVYVKSDCGAGDISLWSTATTFTTTCGTYTALNENFDSIAATTLPNCWSKILRGTTLSTSATIGANATTTYSASSPNALQMYNAGSATSGSDDIILVTPYLSNLGDGTYRLRFNGIYSSSARVQIGTLSTNDAAAVFTPLQNITLTSTNTEYTVNFDTYTGSNRYIGFRMNSTGTFTYVYIDNVVWEPIPTCYPPTSLLVNNIAPTTAKINWDAPSLGLPTQYVYEVRTSGAAGSGATGLVAAASGTTTGAPIFVNVAGLTPNTAYTVYVRSSCGAGDFSAWSTAATFTTLCDSTVVPYTEDFESVTTPAIPVCTLIQNAGTGNDWTTSSPGANGFTSKTLTYIFNSSNAANAWFYTRGISLTAGTNYVISYKYGTNSTIYTEKLKVMYGTATNSTSMTLPLADHSSVTGTVPATNSVVFTPPATGVYYFGFNAYSASNQNRLYVDDISVNVAPSCLTPTGITYNNVNPVAGTVNLAWVAPTFVTPQSYQYILTNSSTAPATATGALTTTATSVTGYTGLVQGQTYYVWVRSFCGGTDYSTWSSSTSFTVPYAVPAPWVEPFTTYDSPTGFTFTDSSVNEYTDSAGPFTGNPAHAIMAFLGSSANSGTSSASFETVNVGPVSANQFFSFDYGTRNLGATTSPSVGSFTVQISTNFGATYTTLATINNDGVTGYRNLSYPLTAYAGQFIKVKISVTRSSGNWFIGFDNLSVQGTCTGAPNQGTITLPSQSVCGILPPTPLTVTGASYDIGVAFQWQQSTNGGSTWVNAVGGSNATTTTYSPPVYAGTPILYRMRSTCSGNSVYTTNVSSIDGVPKTVPFRQPFDAVNDVAGWYLPEYWHFGTQRGAVGNPSGNISVNLYSQSNSSLTSATVVTYPFGPILAGQAVSLDYSNTNYDTPATAPAAGSGKFEVFISNDCGVNFTSLGVTTNDGLLGYRTLIYPLPGSYVGQNIVLKIVATWTSGDYDLSFDNIGVATPPPTITSFSPANICAGVAGTIVLQGTYLDGVTQVTIGDKDVVTAPESAGSTFSYNSTTGQITITLAAGNTFPTGLISVINSAGGRANSLGNFTFKPFPAPFTVTGSTTTLCSNGSFTTLGTSVPTSGNLWTSTNPAVATVDGNGKVTGVSPGQSVIGFSVIDNGCQTFNSNTYTVTVKQKIQFTQQPANVYAQVGNTRKLKVVATGDGNLTYQWYRRLSASSSTLLTNSAPYSGTTTNEITITNIPQSLDGAQYYCIVSSDSGCSSLNSNIAILSIGAISIDSDPESVSQCNLAPATFSVTVESSDPAVAATDLIPDTLYTITTVGDTDFTLIGAASNTVGTVFTATGPGEGTGSANAVITYQWGIDDPANGFTPLVNNSKYSGVTTTSLTVTPTAALTETYLFRVYPISSDLENTYIESNAATFSAQVAPSIQTQPVSLTSCKVDGTKTFTIAATGGVNSIQWQSSSTGAANSWSNVGTGTSLPVSVTTSSPVGVTYYRALVNGFGSCGQLVSDTVTLTISQPSVSIAQSAAFYCTPGGTAVTLTASGTAANYTWSGTGLSATTGAVVNATPLATTTYTVTATDANTCTSTAQATITAGNRFTVAVTPSALTTCPSPSPAISLTSAVTLVDPNNVPTISGYEFVNTTSPYATIVGGSGTTALSLLSSSSIATMDDGISAAQTLPFTFIYGGNSFNSFKMNSNGWLTFDTSATATQNYTSLSSTVNNVIAALNRDLDGNNTTSTSFYMQTVGTTPNRITKVEWTNFKSYNGASASSPTTGNMQVWLYEGSNVIEIHYGNFAQSGTTGATQFTAQVGLRGTSTSDVKSISNTGAWSDATAGTSNSATVALGTIASPILPDNGRVYQFNPKLAPPANTYTYSWSSNPVGLISNATSTSVSPAATTSYTLTVTAQTGCSASDTKTVTVNPVHAISLSSGSTTPTLCVNTALGTNIVYAVSGGATGAGVTGLPAGMSGTYAAGNFTISGTPTASGTFNYTVTTTGNTCTVATATGTITVRPNHAITLSTGSATPALCINTALGTNIVYAVSGGATGAGVTGLPTGMSGTYAAGNFTISGTPTVSGTFNYTVTTTGNTCLVATATGTITVNAIHAISLSTGSATPTLCVGTALGTNIVYAVSGGATGAGVTGLPTGMSGTYAAGNFTISGTPTVNGTFNYTVTTTGNACTVATATGTITVTANGTISLTSGVNTNNQTVFVGSSIATITYGTTGATGATISGLPTGVSGSWSANAVTISGAPSNTGTFNYTVTLTGGCGAITATGTITSSSLVNWYLDADNDHYYTGVAVVAGPSPGAGYTSVGLIGGGDCDDNNAAINPGAAEICYNNIDDNCNNIKSEGCAPVVVNMTPSYHNTTLPSFSIAVPAVGYTYPGATNLKYRFSVTNITTGVTAPDVIQVSRYVTIPLAIQSYNSSYTITASAVINEEVVPFAGNTITVNAPTVQLVSLSSTSCGATLAALTTTIAANPGLNATGYTFRIRLNDSDANPTYAYSQSSTRYIVANSFTGFPLQYSTSYRIAVQFTFNDPVTNQPVQSGYGTECVVNTPSIPVVGIASPSCGSQVAAMNTTMTATAASYATGYQFRIRLFGDNGANPTYFTTAVLTSRFSALNAFQGITLAYSTEYSISVRYSILNGSTTVWSNYGPECKVITPFFPTTSLVPSQCGLSTATPMDRQLNITPYPGFPHYKVKIDELGDSEDPVATQEREITYSYFKLNEFSLVQPGKRYNVSVAIKLNGVFGDYSTACDLFTPDMAKTAIAEPFKATAHPNPFANNFLIDVKTSSESSVNVKVYDMIGRIIEERDVRVSDMETTTIGERYPSGVYNVVVSQDSDVQTVRVVKR